MLVYDPKNKGKWKDGRCCVQADLKLSHNTEQQTARKLAAKEADLREKEARCHH